MLIYKVAGEGVYLTEMTSSFDKAWNYLTGLYHKTTPKAYRIDPPNPVIQIYDTETDCQKNIYLTTYEFRKIKNYDALKEKLKSKTMRYKSVRMARSLVSYNPLKEGDVSYGYFKYVEEMARENLSGEQIANSPELVYRFFGKPFFL